jgi:CDP-6-deoxy-D-xylo-4-hexulose-3-dehydrase
MQAAIGLAQLGKLPEFIRKRKQNYAFLLSRLQKYSGKLVLPRTIPGADISPFGLPLTVKGNAGFTKNQITEYLESKGIATRVLFGGNLALQPAYANERFEVSGTLDNTNKAMNSTFWVGVYPGLTQEMLEYMAGAFGDFLSSH